jgi:hypothetical protein
MIKIWTNNKFAGRYPVGTAAVVIADTPERAAEFLTPCLFAIGLPPAEAKDMMSMPFVEGQVNILCDGDY